MFSVRTLSASARTLPEAAGAPPEREGPAHVDVGIGADRPARTRVHQVIASTLPFLAASTVTVAEPQTSDPADPASPAKTKAVRVRITRKQRTRPPKARATGQAQAPHRASTAGAAAAGGGGEGGSAGGAARDPALTLGHTVFTLRKERVEHLEAVSRLARAVGASVR